MSYLTTSLNPQSSDPTPRHRGRRVRRPRPILVGGRHRADVDDQAEPTDHPAVTINVSTGDPVEVGREIRKALDAHTRANGGRMVVR